MTNQQIARLLKNIAAAYSIKDEKKFRFQIIAYQKAADAIENATTEVKELFQEGKLKQLPGVGSSIQSHLEELLTTGKVTRFAWVLQDIPESMFTLLDIPSFGPKKAYKLVTHFHLANPETVVDDLEKVAQEGKIAELEGFGAKSQQDILQAISEYKMGKTKTARMVLPFAHELAQKMITYLNKSSDVLAAYPLGSLRRARDTIGDLDIAVSTNNPEVVVKHFLAFPFIERVIEQGDHGASILVSGNKQIDLLAQTPDRFGSLLQHFTGSKHHNIHLREIALKKGLSLSEYGILPIEKGAAPRSTLSKAEIDEDKEKRIPFDTEEKFYKYLGLQWVPPEMREDTGEIELAQRHELPQLIELDDMKGDFHLHSSYPIEPSHDMGRSSMEIMLKKAEALHYKYIGFSEHNPSTSKHSPQQTHSLIAGKAKFIERLQNVNKNIRIYNLLEIDILPNGDLAIDNDSLSLLDFAVISVHSVFSMNKQEMTERVLRGLSHPKAKILAHPTGRLLNQRNGYDLDWEKIFSFCKENNKALEINASPLRLDLPDAIIKQAVQHGVKLIIDTDSHEVGQMDLMRYGVMNARRGWATKDDILNTWEYNEFDQWTKS